MPTKRQTGERNPHLPKTPFTTEAAMLPTLRAAVKALWLDVDPDSTWAILEEQRLHSRIADLLLVRVNVDALHARLVGGWTRTLTLSELRALQSLRIDRATRPATVAANMRVRLESVTPTFQRLARDGYILRTPAGLTRSVPSTPLVRRVVTFETKRDDPRRALQQTRGHREWSHETYVAFDASYLARFERAKVDYERLGVGLIELSHGAWRRVLRARPHRANSLEVALVGERALGRLLGNRALDRPERRLPHGRRLAVEAEPTLIGRHEGSLAELVKRATEPIR